MSAARYTIRPAGKSAWGQTSDKREAVRLYREARDRMPSEQILIYDEAEQREVYTDDLLPPQRPDDV